MKKLKTCLTRVLTYCIWFYSFYNIRRCLSSCLHILPLSTLWIQPSGHGTEAFRSYSGRLAGMSCWQLTQHEQRHENNRLHIWCQRWLWWPNTRFRLYLKLLQSNMWSLMSLRVNKCKRWNLEIFGYGSLEFHRGHYMSLAEVIFLSSFEISNLILLDTFVIGSGRANTWSVPAQS